MIKNKINQRNNNLIMLLLFSLFVLQNLSPFVSRAISKYTTTYMYLGAVCIIFIFIMFRNKKTFSAYGTIILPMLPLILLQFFHLCLYKTQSIVYFLYGILLLLIPIFVGYYILNEKENLHKPIVKVLLIVWLITVITTIVGLFNNPMAARWLASASDTSSPQLIAYNWQNIGGFDFVYMTVLIYPMIICAFKQKKIKLITFLIALFLIGFLLIKAEYAIAVLLFLFSSLLIFQKRNFKVKNVLIIIIFLLIMILFLSPLIADFFRFLAKDINSFTLQQRFLYIADSLEGVATTSDAGLRIELWLKSVTSFLHSPLIGTALFDNYGVGGHSFILDILARWGIIGGGALFIMYRHIYKLFYLPHKEQPYFGYLLWSFCQCIILSTINTGEWIFVLTFAVPMIAHLFKKNIIDKSYEEAEKHENLMALQHDIT